jgi:hypothetical protein
VPLPSRIGGKPLRVEPASSSGSEAAFPLAALPLAGPLAALPLAGLPLAGPLVGPLLGEPLAALALPAGLLPAGAVGSLPGSHAGQVPFADREALQAGHFRPVCCRQVSRSLAIRKI